MAKIGPKEAQRRALAEARAKPRRKVVRASASDASALRSGQLSASSMVSGPGNTEAGGASPSGVVVLPEAGAVPIVELDRAIAAYRKHRDRSRVNQIAYKKRKKGGK